MAILKRKNNTCGRLIKKGRGMASMLNYCYEFHWTDENSVLVVPDCVNSYWSLYEKI